MQNNNYYSFKVYVIYVEWEIVRIIWIGFYKNNKNSKCLIPLLCKDVVQYILNWLGALRVTDNDHRNSQSDNSYCHRKLYL